jgi:hypothetical protein
MIAVIGQAPPAVLGDLSSTRAWRDERRFLRWLDDHRGAAEELFGLQSELGQAAFDAAWIEAWNIAQGRDVWH